MLIRWNNPAFSVDLMDEVRRRMDRMFDDIDPFRGSDTQSVFEPFQGNFFLGGRPTWPKMTLNDTGSAFVLTAYVPGLTEQDVQVSIHQDVLTVSGERKGDRPEGYTVHRQERPALKFSRSFALPHRVDADQVAAELKNGVLTVTLNKAAEAKPRQITVRG